VSGTPTKRKCTSCRPPHSRRRRRGDLVSDRHAAPDARRLDFRRAAVPLV